MAKWKVVCEPEGKNPGRIKKTAAEAGVTNGNAGGMIIFVTDGSRKEEVSRVAWVRRNSKNPKASFETQLGKEVDKAQKAVDTLNGLTAAAGELQ